MAAFGAADHHGAVAGPPVTNPLFGIVLVLHITAALVGFGALAVTALQAHRLGRTSDPTLLATLRRYFRPGVNWAARAVYLVPLLGATLVGLSGGTYRFGDTFVEIGLVLWLVTVLLAEAVLWPAERQVQQALRPPAPAPASPAGDERERRRAADLGGGTQLGRAAQLGRPAELGRSALVDDDTIRACRRLAACGTLVVVLFAAAAAVMVAKP